MTSEIPARHWEKHSDLVLFPSSAFLDPVWNQLEREDWKDIANVIKGENKKENISLKNPLFQILKVDRICKKTGAIIDDDFRSPRVKMIFSKNEEEKENFWVNHVDNGVKYSWDASKSMFSAGNVTEKLRVASLDCR